MVVIAGAPHDLFELVVGWAWSGALGRLAVLYAAMVCVQATLQTALRALFHVEWMVSPPWPLSLWRRDGPSPLRALFQLLPASSTTAYRSIRLDSTARFARVQAGGLVVLLVLIEELVFRGAPLALAEATGLSAGMLLGAGTIVWAFFHGTGKGIALILTVGWFYAALWLVGHGGLAIGLHLGKNVTLTVLNWAQTRLGGWLSRGH